IGDAFQHQQQRRTRGPLKQGEQVVLVGNRARPRARNNALVLRTGMLFQHLAARTLRTHTEALRFRAQRLKTRLATFGARILDKEFENILRTMAQDGFHRVEAGIHLRLMLAHRRFLDRYLRRRRDLRPRGGPLPSAAGFPSAGFAAAGARPPPFSPPFSPPFLPGNLPDATALRTLPGLAFVAPASGASTRSILRSSICTAATCTCTVSPRRNLRCDDSPTSA